MPKTNLGKVSVTPRGAYDAGTQYEALDAVSHAGGSWLACKASQGVEPGTDPESWMHLAEKGETGDTGPQGAPGKDGADGSPGPAGQNGQDGAAATIRVGEVVTLEPGQPAAVENTGTAQDAVLKISIPRGQDGNDGDPGQAGAAATIQVGQVTTLPAGQQATVTNVGTANAARFDFAIPSGANGKDGADGAPGQDGADGQPGADGEDGGYYTPSVDTVGNLTWTPSKAGMPAVEEANIRGPQGPASDPAQIDALYNVLANKCATKAELDQLFVDWWHGQWVEGKSSYNSMLARWFGTVLHDGRVHGVKLPLFATSESPTGELTDDSVGLVCEPSTEAEAKQDDFAHLPQFWCCEVAAEKNADGTHTIYACEFIDPLDVVRAGGPDDGKHLVWVLQKNTYTREWDEGGYRYFKMRCDPAEGYETWPQGTDRQGTVYPYMANPKYYAGLEADGSIGCRTGLPPVNYSSHNDDVALWRQRGSQYAGVSGNLLKWQLAMIWLKYGVKGNSGTIEGHSSQNLQYTAAVSESGVQRILLTTAQAANFKVGYNVIIGVQDTATQSYDRGYASMYSIRKNKRVTKIETVELEGQSYGAVYVEDGDNVFDTTASATYISNMPYWSGWNDTVQGNDGSRYNPANGHDTGLIQKTEFQNGAYLILADELWQWGTDAEGNFTFDCYTCHDQTKITTNGSISGDYEKQEDLTLTFPARTADSWLYIEDTAIGADRGVLWPAKVSTAAGSGTGVKDGFYNAPRASGVRAGWCCDALDYWGFAGLAARDSSTGTANRNWNGCAGVPGLSG